MEENRAFASPGPAGLMALGFYLTALWPVSTGLVGGEGAFLLIPIGFAGAIIQLSCGVINLRNKEILSGNMMMAFSAFMWLGCISNLLKFMGIAPATGLVLGDAAVTLVMGMFMLGFTGPFMKNGIIPGCFMITTDIFFVFSGLGMLTGIRLFKLIGAWVIPFIVFTIVWSVLAEVHNTLYQRDVISVGKPMMKTRL